MQTTFVLRHFLAHFVLDALVALFNKKYVLQYMLSLYVASAQWTGDSSGSNAFSSPATLQETK